MTDLFSLEGKTAIITGGSRGLGREMALAFAEHGANIVVASRKVENCETVANEVRALGRRALAVGYHAASWSDAKMLATAAIAEFGHIDILVNNAGMSPLYSSLVEVTEDFLDIDPFAAPHTSRRHTPYPIFEDPSSEFYGLTAIQYQGEIILWLQREYGLHVQVEYTLYEDYLVAQNQRQNIYPKYTARLSDLLLLNRVIKSIVHNDAWYLPENPEFEYGCLINIRGSIVYFTIPV